MLIHMASTSSSNMQWSELPTELRKQLQAVNLNSIEHLQQRLAQRRTAQILSYLQLTVLRLCNEQSLKTRHVQQIQDADDRATYLDLLHKRDNFLHTTSE